MERCLLRDRFVQNFWQFLVVSIVLTMVDRDAGATWGNTLIAVTLLPPGLGVLGWICLGVWFAAAGVMFVHVVRWAERRSSVASAVRAA